MNNPNKGMMENLRNRPMFLEKDFEKSERFFCFLKKI